MKKLVALLVLVAAFCAFSVPAFAAYKAEYKLDIVPSLTTSWGMGAVYFTELVKERSGGKINIKVYPNAQLTTGQQTNAFMLLRNGTIDFACQSTINYSPQIVELNLDHSSRTFGRPLTANEILESWRGRAPTWNLGGGGGSGDSDDEEEDVETNAPAAFDAVNLYDLYRAMRALRAKLAGLDQNPDIQRAYLVGRPDSAMALAHLADRDAEAPIVRYLVLRELCSVVSDWASLLDDDLVSRAKQMADKARTRTNDQLQQELKTERSNADELLDWFEQALTGLDREVKA